MFTKKELKKKQHTHTHPHTLTMDEFAAGDAPHDGKAFSGLGVWISVTFLKVNLKSIFLNQL